MVAAHQSNLAEIAAGNAAQARATTDTVRDLGAMFVRMHSDLDAQLTAAATTLGVQLPDAPTPAQQQQLAAVEANQGSAFDTAWIAQQLGAHRQSLAAGQQEIAAGSDPAVVALATAAGPVIEQHLGELQAAAAQYGVPVAVEAGTGGQATTKSTWLPLGMTLAVLGLVMVALGAWRFGQRRS